MKLDQFGEMKTLSKQVLNQALNEKNHSAVMDAISACTKSTRNKKHNNQLLPQNNKISAYHASLTQRSFVHHDDRKVKSGFVAFTPKANNVTSSN